MTLIRLTMVEMRRALHRRLVRWMVALAVFLSAFAGVIVFVTSADRVDSDHPARLTNWWTPGGSGDGYLLVAAMFLVIGATICAASVGGAEWRAGTMTTLLTWQPSRWLLHGARVLSACVLAFLISLALQIVFLGCALPAVLANGTTQGADAEFWSTLVLAMLRISLMVAIVAVLAISIATLGRNTSAALIVVAAWAMVVERLIAGLRPQWARFMISENVATVVPWTPMSNVEFERPPIVALAALIGYCLVIAVAGAWSFSRRDVATT